MINLNAEDIQALKDKNIKLAEGTYSPVWDSKYKKMHLALDIQDGKVWLSQFIPFVNGTLEEHEELALINSERLMKRVDDKLLMDMKINPIETPAKIDNRWSLQGIRDFIEGKTYTTELKEVFDMVKNEIIHYLDLPDERMYDFMTCWIIGTYFHPMFNSYPYVYLNAMKRSGKTKLLTLVYCLAFNSKFTLSLTPSTLFRLVQANKCTLVMDEEEKLTDKDKIDYRSMLLGGYKKGMKVPRSQEGKKKSHFTVSEYEVYAPKIMANIGGIEDVLEDRCITLILLRTTNRRKSNSEIDINDVKWQNIRDKLYDNLMLNHQQISRCYNLLSDTFTSDGIEDSDVVSVVTDVSVDIYGYRKLENNNNSSISSTLTTDTTQTTLKKLENIRARDLELWQPILSIALAIDEDIFSKLTDFAIENIKNKEVENQTESYDSILIESLIDVIEEDRYYKVSEILSKMIMYVGADEKSREYNWLNNKWLGRAMRRLGFLDKRRMGVGVEYHLSPEGIRFLAMRSKVGLDKYIKKTEQKIL